MRSAGPGWDGRVVAGLCAATLLAVGTGYLVASSLDGPGRVGALAAPALPAPGPEPVGAEPLPPVPAPQPPPQTAPPVPASPAAPTPPAAIPGGGTPRPAPDEPGEPVSPAPADPEPAPPRPDPPDPPAPEPPAPAEPAPPPQGAPFRPDPLPVPLPQTRVAETALPGTVAALATLRRIRLAPSTSPATRSDVRWLLRLGERFATARLPGRRAAVERTLRINAWWYSRRPAPARRVLVRDAAGLVYSYGAGRGFALNPVGTAGRWQKINDDVSPVGLAEALLSVGVASHRGGRAALVWEYYDVPTTPSAVRPGISGMAQARIAQVMARAYRDTGDTRFRDAAARSLVPLSVAVDAGGVRSMLAPPGGGAPPAPWYVERAYPGADPWLGAALNGFMVAILEVRAAESHLRARQPEDPVTTAAADEARALADAGASSLAGLLDLHDSGEWSYYAMLTPRRPWRTYLAPSGYHCYHVDLLGALGALYPDAPFAATRERWAGYAARAGVRCPGGASGG